MTRNQNQIQKPPLKPAANNAPDCYTRHQPGPIDACTELSSRADALRRTAKTSANARPPVSLSRNTGRRINYGLKNKLSTLVKTGINEISHLMLIISLRLFAKLCGTNKIHSLALNTNARLPLSLAFGRRLGGLDRRSIRLENHQQKSKVGDLDFRSLNRSNKNDLRFLRGDRSVRTPNQIGRSPVFQPRSMAESVSETCVQGCGNQPPNSERNRPR